MEALIPSQVAFDHFSCFDYLQKQPPEEFYKKLPLKTSQYSQENTYVGVF